MNPVILFRFLGSMLLFCLLFSCTQAPSALQAQAPERTGAAADSLIKFFGGMHNTYFLSGGETESYLYLEATAGRYVPPASGLRTPLNISLVIDRSGSMSGKKIEYVKRAAHFVVDNLGSEDIFSIVIYDDKIETLVPSGRLRDKALVKSKINEIYDRGSTNLCGGMLEGYAQVKSTYQKGYVNRVLLLTDGLANQGITDPQQIMQIARNKNIEDGITISTFGVGADFNENLLTGIAENGSGNYYFIASPEDIPGIFEKEMKGLLAVVAQDMKLTITLDAAVSLRQVFGYPYEQRGSTVTIFFRDVNSEETKAVLLKVAMPGSQTTVTLSARLEYDDATKGFQHRALESKHVIAATTDRVVYDKAYSEKVMQQVTLFESNYLLEQAMKAVDDGKYEDARAYTTKNELYLKEQFKTITPTTELQKQEEMNTTYKVKLQQVESMNSSDKNMMQKEGKSLNYDLKKKK